MNVTAKQIRLFHYKYTKEESLEGCWEWLYATNSAGYGLFRVPPRCQLAHRVSYWIHKGPFDLQKDLMHTCDNPACVNPDHLKLCDHAMNMADRIAKGRARASQRKRTDLKLDLESARKIKNLLAEGKMSQRAIGRLMGVSQATVRFVMLGRIWADA